MDTKQPEALRLEAEKNKRMAAKFGAEGFHFHVEPDTVIDMLDRIAELEAQVKTVEAGYAAARLEIASLHAQMDAVGAGGMEPLRKRCLHQISEPVGAKCPSCGAPSEVAGFVCVDCYYAEQKTGELSTDYVQGFTHGQATLAPPQSAAQALDAGQWTQYDLREFCAIGRATNRSAVDLPDFSRIRIDLENGSGAVYWLGNKAGQWRCIDSGDLLSTQIDAAIDAARAAQEGK